MNNKATVSIVIPTRNRLDSLNRTLASISKQTYFPNEILISDSSDTPLLKEQLHFSDKNLCLINSLPSVCLQRNIGIEKSNSDYVFLCDDDIEVSENYIEELVNYLEANPSENIACGLLFERRGGKWNYCKDTVSIPSLIMAYVFGFSLGIDIDKTVLSNHFIVQKIINHYKKKGNHISKSGWPSTIRFNNDAFKTPIYGLGASVIRAKKLKNVFFDTTFYTHGIGDNYDLAISLNSPVNVIKKATATHYKETINRLASSKAYYYRVGALHYIMLKHNCFSPKNLLFLIWSLMGNFLLLLKRGEFKKMYYNALLILRIITNRSLYKPRK